MLIDATKKNRCAQDGNVEDQKLDGGDEEGEVGNDGRNRGSDGGVVDLAALEVVLLQIALGQSDSDLQGELDCTWSVREGKSQKERTLQLDEDRADFLEDGDERLSDGSRVGGLGVDDDVDDLLAEGLHVGGGLRGDLGDVGSDRDATLHADVLGSSEGAGGHCYAGKTRRQDRRETY
jgi:hypothetical protein